MEDQECYGCGKKYFAGTCQEVQIIPGRFLVNGPGGDLSKSQPVKVCEDCFYAIAAVAFQELSPAQGRYVMQELMKRRKQKLAG